eukprot:8698292-Ditylum_brightwellii.AAC.1
MGKRKPEEVGKEKTGGKTVITIANSSTNTHVDGWRDPTDSNVDFTTGSKDKVDANDDKGKEARKKRKVDLTLAELTLGTDKKNMVVMDTKVDMN